MQLIKQDDISIPDIVSALKSGKTIIYPTETCYGLGCDALSADAVKKVFQIKKRQKDKPVLVVVSDESMITDYVVWNEELVTISEHYWPGPLTVVADAKSDMKLPQGILGSNKTLAFRVTDHPLASEISASLGHPLVSTSANISELESPYDMESVLGMFENADVQPDIIIDAGPLPHKSPSTVVRVKDGDVKILRQGELVLEL
ncbi:threonylcarbamoyl-AMP synthase [Candidatus Parcubacteria bacterium]|nr:MAG: threonylcarbamoyl-AMP synthase [Candidatus Parcubacteria bacterium]